LKEFEALYGGIADPARRSYAAMISTTDHYIGRILEKIEALGLRENTIIIFMSDNGHSEETGLEIRVDHHASGYPKGHAYGASGGGNTGPWTGHKSQFLEGGIRVPAIISFPSKLPQNLVRDQIITAMDWFPTVLNLCGIKPAPDAPKLDGHDLTAVIESADTESAYGGVLHFAWGNTWAVRDGEWKLIGSKGQPGGSLHRLTDEQPEVTDHAANHPDIVARLTALHDAWIKEVTPATR
jgi:arylsulfatase A-like enzyme